MAQNNMDFSALVGSRICHDLISPVGAIGNGIELLGMGGGTGPELDLIADSVGNANARIRFYRIAFGYAGPDQMVGANEVRTVLSDLAQGARVRFHWNVPRDTGRQVLRAIFQGLMCMETALPFGGEVEIDEESGQWQIAARGQRLSVDEELWGGLARKEQTAEITPSRVQFALLPQSLSALGREARLQRGPDTLILTL